MSDTAIPNRYKYDDIHNEGRFRLLTILPSSAQNESTAIRCSLELRPLPADIPYEALSYAWGKCPADHEILVNDSTFLVSRTVFCALRELRHAEQKRVLWIDAICINQSDNVEKGHQVSQMHQIYSQAERVIVWLGEGNDVSELGMQTLRAIFAGCSLLGESPDSKFTAIEAFRMMLYILWTLSDLELRLRGLIMIYCQSWFSRVRILQKIILAKDATVYFGRVQVPWIYLQAFAHNIMLDEAQRTHSLRRLGPQSLNETVKELVIALEKLSNIAVMKERSSDKRIPLEELLYRTFRFNVTCTMDKIYALLGLCVDTYGIYPGYSLSLRKCFFIAWKAILIKTGCVSLLGMVRVPKPDIRLPTWVPAISTSSPSISNMAYRGLYRFDQKLYQAAPNSIPAFLEFLNNAQRVDPYPLTAN